MRLTPDELRMYDSSAMQFGDDYTRDCENDDTNKKQKLEPTVEEPLPPAGQVRLVRKLTQDQFRSRLVEHFDILFRKNQIKWPRRVRVNQPAVPGNHGPQH